MYSFIHQTGGFRRARRSLSNPGQAHYHVVRARRQTPADVRKGKQEPWRQRRRRSQSCRPRSSARTTPRPWTFATRVSLALIWWVYSIGKALTDKESCVNSPLQDTRRCRRCAHQVRGAHPLGEVRQGARVGCQVRQSAEHREGVLPVPAQASECVYLLLVLRLV